MHPSERLQNGVVRPLNGVQPARPYVVRRIRQTVPRRVRVVPSGGVVHRDDDDDDCPCMFFQSFRYSIIVIAPDVHTYGYTVNDSHYTRRTVAAHQTILFLGDVFFRKKEKIVLLRRVYRCSLYDCRTFCRDAEGFRRWPGMRESRVLRPRFGPYTMSNQREYEV